MEFKLVYGIYANYCTSILKFRLFCLLKNVCREKCKPINQAKLQSFLGKWMTDL